MRKPGFRPHGHPPPAQLSQHLDGELTGTDRVALEEHLRSCPECRRAAGSLAWTIRALGSMREPNPPELAERIIVALRVADFRESAPRARPARTATVTRSSGRLFASRGTRPSQSWLRPAQLRVTVPTALLVGVMLSLVNQGGMLLAGRIDAGMCAICALDFLVPFLALNVALLAVARLGGRRT